MSVVNLFAREQFCKVRVGPTFGILRKTVSRFRWFEAPPLHADSKILPCYMVVSCCPWIGWLVSLSRAACNGSEHAHNMGLCRCQRTTSSAFTFVMFVSFILPLHGTLFCPHVSSVRNRTFVRCLARKQRWRRFSCTDTSCQLWRVTCFFSNLVAYKLRQACFPDLSKSGWIKLLQRVVLFMDQSPGVTPILIFGPTRMPGVFRC